MLEQARRDTHDKRDTPDTSRVSCRTWRDATSGICARLYRL